MNISDAIRLGYSAFEPLHEIYEFHPCAVESELRVSGTCPNPGYRAEKTSTLFDAAGLAYELVNIDELGARSRDLILNGTIDVMINFLRLITPERQEQFRFTHPLETKSSVSAIFSVKNQVTDVSQMLQSLFIFTPLVWCLILSSHVLYKLTLVTIKANPKLKWLHLNKKHKLMIHLLFDFLAGAFLSLYGNFLLAGLLVQPERPIFTNFDEMLESIGSRQIRFETRGNGPIIRYIQNSKLESGRMFRAALARNPPETLVDYTYYKMENLDNRKIFHIRVSTVADWKANTDCGYRAVELLELGFMPSALMFHKDFDDQIMDRLNSAMFGLYETFAEIDRKYERLAKTDNSQKCVPQEHQWGITLKSLMVLFCGVIGLYLIAFICFLAEMLFNMSRKLNWQ